MNTGTKILAGVVIIVVIGFLVYWFERTPAEETPIETPNTTETNNNGTLNGTVNSTTSAATSTNTTSTGKYKNGTYSATGSYVSPGGKQNMSVSLTINNDKVTKVTLTEGAIDATSKSFQNRFIGGVQTLVVGTSLDQVKVGVVSGSSLSAGGFMDALAKIKVQAMN